MAVSKAIQNMADVRAFTFGGKATLTIKSLASGRKLTHPESIESGLGPVCKGI